ncbi:hypothetical protein RJ639_007460, partial [Escallonia herrerae]
CPKPHNQVLYRSYMEMEMEMEMEKRFKVFVYEGERPIFHDGPCKNIYSTERIFINQIETCQFRTSDLEKAHIYFLPFSVTRMVQFVYKKDSGDHWGLMKQAFSDYVNVIAGKYTYWNHSLGFDHFILSCHDWGPGLSTSVPKLYNNSIRALCDANRSEGFKPSRDDNYVAPFNDVRNWKTFSVEISIKDVPNLKKILTVIPWLVRQHFEVNLPLKRFDFFHMILHSIWLRRLYLGIHYRS